MVNTPFVLTFLWCVYCLCYKDFVAKRKWEQTAKMRKNERDMTDFRWIRKSGKSICNYDYHIRFISLPCRSARPYPSETSQNYEFWVNKSNEFISSFDWGMFVFVSWAFWKLISADCRREKKWVLYFSACLWLEGFLDWGYNGVIYKDVVCSSLENRINGRGTIDFRYVLFL